MLYKKPGLVKRKLECLTKFYTNLDFCYSIKIRTNEYEVFQAITYANELIHKPFSKRLK